MALQSSIDVETIRWTLVAIVLSVGAPCWAFSDDAHLVSGRGLPRADENECEAHREALKAKLEQSGLSLAKPIECLPVDGEAPAYEPHFTARTQSEAIIESAMTGYVSDKNQCERVLAALLNGVAESSEQILESGCALLRVTDLSSGEAQEQFQPTVILLMRQPGRLVRR